MRRFVLDGVQTGVGLLAVGLGLLANGPVAGQGTSSAMPATA
jgi:hypothetical protein